jgi:CRISPR-associated protein Cmr3
MSATHLCLTARDGFFFKDGRGWSTSDGAHAGSHDWPFPTTLLGALRAQWGRHHEAARGAGTFTKHEWLRETKDIALGATFPMRRTLGERWGMKHRMWPVPADAVHLRDGVKRLDEWKSLADEKIGSLGRSDDDARESLWFTTLGSPEKPVTAPRWWTEAQMVAWLEGRAPNFKNVSLDAQTMKRRTDIHLAIDPGTYSAFEGMLYAKDVVETQGPNGEEWGIAMKAELPATRHPGFAEGTWLLGGDSRAAHAEALEPGHFAPPQNFGANVAKKAGGLRLITVTPAHFADGWLPDGFSYREGEYRGRLPGVAAEVTLLAALVSRPVHTSGWDMEKGSPKRTLRLVAPGAVYFFAKSDRRSSFSAAEVGSLWLAAIGRDTHQGLGRVVPGNWDL